MLDFQFSGAQAFFVEVQLVNRRKFKELIYEEDAGVLTVTSILAVRWLTAEHAQIARETRLMMKDLPDVPRKEGLIETVALPPGEVSGAHRPNAYVFVYVVEGSIITQLEGGNFKTVHTDEVFYESPTDVPARVAIQVRRNPQSYSSSL